MISYELALTYDCNWKCSYCCVDTHNQKTINIVDVMNKIKTFENDSSCTLSGGEPGMIKKNDMDKIILALQNKNITIDLVTNGLFFERHSEHLKNISDIFYHCIESLDNPYIKRYPLDLVYVIVAEDSSFDKIIKIIKDNKDIKFLISVDNTRTGTKTLSNFIKFYKEYKELLHPRTYSEFKKHMLMKD